MPFPVYDREMLVRFALATFHNRMDVDVSEGSFWYRMAVTWADALTTLSGFQQHIALQMLPDTAADEALERHARLRGVARNPACKAQGRVSIRLTDD